MVRARLLAAAACCLLCVESQPLYNTAGNTNPRATNMGDPRPELFGKVREGPETSGRFGKLSSGDTAGGVDQANNRNYGDSDDARTVTNRLQGVAAVKSPQVNDADKSYTAAHAKANAGEVRREAAAAVAASAKEAARSREVSGLVVYAYGT